MGTPVFSGNRAPGVDDVTLYLAARILKRAGFDTEAAARALREIYGLEVAPIRMELWFQDPPPFKASHVLACIEALKREALPALQYAVGAALGDGDKRGELEVADWEFAHAYASAVATLTGAPVRVRRREGRYRVSGCRFVGYIAKSPLWKAVAYLDKFDERKHFLAGLMDAEGSIIPIVDRKHRNLRVRVQFANTSYELAAYVRDTLKELGFEPNIKVVEPGDDHIKRGGGAVRRKRTLYKVFVDLNPSQIEPLLKVGFNCSRKRLLLDFFLEVKDLPPRQRYEEFQRRWRKIRGKWWPSIPSQLRRNRTLIVECPKCKKAGTFELHREVKGGKTRAKAVIHHGSGTCEIDIAEKEIKEGENPLLINCPKCGRIGYIYTTAGFVNTKKRPHMYVIMRAAHTYHKRSNTTPTCTLLSLRVLSIQTNQPPPAQQETKM